jgi:outer membrane protein OmpU
MNNLKKIGLSALAGSLAAFTANAAEMSVSGSAKLTYNNGDGSEVTGNPYGMNTSLGFTGSGDVNGYETTLFITSADQFGGMSSASLAVDLGDLGTLTFDQGVGVGGISTIDDKTPSANEEVWDALDAIVGDNNGLVGGGNSGAFVYANTFGGASFSAQYTKGGSAANTDDARGSGASQASGTSVDFALTSSALAEGLEVGIGFGDIANAGSSPTGVASDETDKHSTAFLTYTYAGVTGGVQRSKREDNTFNGDEEKADAWSVAANLMEGLSVSYGERDIEHSNGTAAAVDEEIEGMAVAYTMGAAKLSIQNNETKNNGGTVNTVDENLEIALSLSF